MAKIEVQNQPKKKEHEMNDYRSDVMDILVVVDFPEMKTRASEQAMEEDILTAVRTAVSDDTIIDVKVKQLDYEDCKSVLECGMPLEKYGVVIRQDGSWYSGLELFPEEVEAYGEDLKSLFEYLVGRGVDGGVG